MLFIFFLMSLIGLIGKKGSGKSTAANYISNKYEYIEKTFSESLKLACKQIFMFTDDQINGSQEKKEEGDLNWFGCSPRKIMQFVGTDLLRNRLKELIPEIKEDIFVRNVELWYNNNKDKNVVISDVRFMNEKDMIKKNNGILIKIIREVNNDSHISENEQNDIIDYDYIIHNNTNIKDFEDKLDNIMKDIKISLDYINNV